MKKMNKKGFTLIELLAIIVILAIIAVITVPIILNIIENARQGAAKNSVVGYGKAVELAYTQYQFEKELPTASSNKYLGGDTTNGSGISIRIGSATATPTTLKVDFDGDKVVCNGENTIIDGKVELKSCKVNGNDNYVFNYKGGEATK